MRSVTVERVFVALIFFGLSLTPAALHGQTQTLTAYWDANPPADQVTNYEVCLGTVSLSCNIAQDTVPSSQTSFTFTPSPGTLYYFAVRAMSGSTLSAYSAEVTASIPNLAQPANQTSTVNVAITALNLSVSDPDGGTLEYSSTGLPLGLAMNASTGRITGTPTATGVYNVTVSVFDNLITVFKSFTWTVGDTVAPTLAITSHTSGQTPTSASVTLSGTATDNAAGGSGITSVTVNGQAATGGTATGNGTASWSRSLTLSSGANVLTVAATDGAGNVRSTPITLNLSSTPSDTAAPTLAIASHTSGQTLSSASVTVSGTATDNATGGSGIASVTVNGQAATGGTATGSGTAGWSRSLTLSTGANVVTVVATDGAGNPRSSQITLNLSSTPSDTAAPTLAIGSPTSGQTLSSASVTVSGTATDNAVGGSGIASVTVNGQAATGGTATGNGTANWSRSLTLSSGANVLTVVATDGAGNTRTTPITVNVTLPDTTAPTLTILSPTSGQTVTSTVVALSGTATDNGTGGHGITSVAVNGQAASGGTASGTGTASWTRSMTLSAGPNVVTVAATDGAGNARSAQITINVSLPPAANTPMAVSLAASIPSGQVVGATVTFTATATGGVPPYDYSWFVRRENGAWQNVQGWSGAATYAWTPTAAGNHYVAIWARRAGATAEAWQASAERLFVIYPPAAPAPSPEPAPAPPQEPERPRRPAVGGPMTGVAFDSSLPSGQTVGTSVTFTATGTGGVAPYQYRWWVRKDGGRWQELQGWRAAPTLAWTPTAPGNYDILIWAKNASSTASRWEADAQRQFVVYRARMAGRR